MKSLITQNLAITSRFYKVVALVFGVFFLLLFANPTSALAATYYISSSGNDSSAGTITNPFRTFSKAAGIVAPGDTVFVRAGTYSEAINIYRSGNASNYITFQPYSGETVIIDGTNISDLVVISGSYVKFNGFNIRNARRTGLTVWAARNVHVQNNTFYNNIRGAIWVGDSQTGRSTGHLIEGNIAYNNVLENVARNWTGGWALTIGVSASTDTVVRGNRVYRNYGEGIGSHSSRGVEISGNVVYDNYSVGLYLDNSRDAKIQANLVYSTGNTTFYRSGKPAIGIASAIENTEFYNPLANNSIVNNIVLNSRFGIQYGNYERGGGMQSNIISHNTIVNATDAALAIDSSSGHSGNILENNIFYRSTSGTLATGARSGFAPSHNCWFNGSAGNYAGTGDVTADPRFVNGQATDAAGFQLQLGSPCATVGKTVSSVTSDYFGAPRTAPYSIGAHELDETKSDVPVEPTPTDPQPGDGSTTTPVTQNIVLNGNFDGQLADWSNWGNTTAITGTHVNSGTYAARVGTGDGGFGQDVRARVTNGRTYTLTGVAKVGNTSEVFGFGMEARRSDNSIIPMTTSSWASVTGTGYAPYQVTFTVPSDAARVFVFAWKNAGTSYGYIDSLVLCEQGTNCTSSTGGGTDGPVGEDPVNEDPVVVPFSFVSGASVQTTTRVDVRASSNTSSKRLGRQNKGTTGVLTQGPAGTGSNTMWFVDFASGVDGWVLQSQLEVTAMPVVAKAPTPVKPVVAGVSHSNVGAKVVVQDALRVRENPYLTARVLRMAAALSTGEVIDEQVGTDTSHSWLKVRYEDGVVGWSAAPYLKAHSTTSQMSTMQLLQQQISVLNQQLQKLQAAQVQ